LDTISTLQARECFPSCLLVGGILHTMQQERVPIEKLAGLVEEKVGVRKVLERLG